MSTLYLIPCPIAENALHTVPTYAQEIARNLDIFIAERAKTARHFIKSLSPARPLQEMTWVEIPDNQSAEEALEALRTAFEAGKNVGLLSEAGCPGVADPGAVVVALAHRLGMKVVPLVGPSSLLLALMASGMNGQKFSFQGYLPPTRPELAKELRRLESNSRQQDQTQIFIETPYRSQMVLEVALESLQPSTYFGVAQDISGASEFIRSLPVRDWQRLGVKNLEKLPGVFMVYAGV